MKLSDYVASFLAGLGIKHVFVVTGGAAAHLIDSVAKYPGIDYVLQPTRTGSGDGAGRIHTGYQTHGRCDSDNRTRGDKPHDWHLQSLL